MTDLQAAPLTSTRRVRLLGSSERHRTYLYDYLGVEEVRRYLAPNLDPVETLRDTMRTRAVVHPGVVRVHDLVSDADGVALRTEYVPGRDLAHLVDESGVLTSEALALIGAALADAIDASHRRDIPHGAIHPGNVIVRDEDGTPVLTDFGVATADRTSAKLAFVAPELRAGGAATRAGDVWALGATLYFLATGRAPRQSEGSVDVEPAPTLLPHIPARLWTVLAPTLATAPDARPTAAAIAKDLREYTTCITCPACAQVFRMESIAGRCPEPACGSELAELARQAWIAQVSAEVHVADCTFAAAAPHLARAAAACRDFDPAAAAGLDALAGALHSLASRHDAATAAFAPLLANESWVDAARQLHEARLRFSRSPALRALRGQLREQLAAFHAAVPSRAQNECRSRRFDAARALCTAAERIIGDAVANHELRAGLGQEPERFEWLQQEVDRQEQTWRTELRRADAAIAAFRFDEALEAYTRLERDFPAPEHRAAIDALVQAPADFAAATRHADDALRQLVRRPDLHQQRDDLDLEEARRACQRLLASFDPDRHPPFRQFVLRAELLDEAMCAVRKHVRDRLEAAEAARGQGQLFAELEHLNAVRDLVLKSDLYDLHQREHTLARHRQALHDVERVRNLHTQAQAALTSREYARALTHLREIRELGARCLPDLGELTRTAEATLRRLRDLRTEVVRLFGRLQATSPMPEVVHAVEKAAALHQLCDDAERKSWDSETARVLAGALHRLQEACLAIDSGPDAVVREVVPLLHAGFVPLAHALPREQWVELIRSEPELSRRLCAVAEAALPAVADLEALLRQALAWAQFWSGDACRLLLAAAEPPAGVPHPTVLLAQRLVDACQLTERRTRLVLQSDLADLTQSLEALAPGTQRELLDAVGAELRRRCAQDNLAIRLDGLRQRTLRVAPWMLVIAAVAAGAFHLGDRRGVTRGTQTAVIWSLPRGVDPAAAAAFVARHGARAVTTLALAHDLQTALAAPPLTDTVVAGLVLRLHAVGDPPTDAPAALREVWDGARTRLLDAFATRLVRDLDRHGDMDAARDALEMFSSLAGANVEWSELERLTGERAGVTAVLLPRWLALLGRLDATTPSGRVLRAAARAHVGAVLQREVVAALAGDLSAVVARTGPLCAVLTRLGATDLSRRSVLPAWPAVVDALAGR